MLLPDLSNVPTAELITTLKVSGYDVPDGLPEEIVRRAGDAIEPLCALVRDDALWEAREPHGHIAPIHAMHVLGAIGDAAVAPILVAIVKTRNLGDFLTESAPAILAALPPDAVTPLQEAAADASLGTFQRHAFARGLYGIAARHPERRGDVAAFFTRLLRDEDEDEELVSLLVDDAARMDDPEVQAAIDAAFDEDRVFTDLICRSDIERLRGEPRWSIPADLEAPMAYFRGGDLAAMKQRWEAARRRATQAVQAS
ncbi:MAG: DUF1186 domain-containing protein [Byssovorax sp.]